MFRLTTKTRAELANAKLDNSILRQQLKLFELTIDYQAQTIAKLKQQIKFYEMVEGLDLDYPNSKEN